MTYCYEHGLQPAGTIYCPVCHKAVLAEPPADVVVEQGAGEGVEDALPPADVVVEQGAGEGVEDALPPEVT